MTVIERLLDQTLTCTEDWILWWISELLVTFQVEISSSADNILLQWPEISWYNIYIYLCLYFSDSSHRHTQTIHKHIYVCIYIRVYVYMCVCVCIYICQHVNVIQVVTISGTRKQRDWEVHVRKPLIWPDFTFEVIIDLKSRGESLKGWL